MGIQRHPYGIGLMTIPLRCPNVQDAIVTTRILYFLARVSQPKHLPLLLGWGKNPRYENKHVEHEQNNSHLPLAIIFSPWHKCTSFSRATRSSERVWISFLSTNYKQYLTFNHSTKKNNIESSSGGFEQQQQQQQQQQEQEAGRVHKHPIPSWVRHKHRLLPFDRFVQHTNSPCSGHFQLLMVNHHISTDLMPGFLIGKNSDEFRVPKMIESPVRPQKLIGGSWFLWITLPETNSKFAPENRWLEYDCFLLVPGPFPGANCQFQGGYCQMNLSFGDWYLWPRPSSRLAKKWLRVKDVKHNFKQTQTGFKHQRLEGAEIYLT